MSPVDTDMSNFTPAQTKIIDRTKEKTKIYFAFYADYIDEPYDDYFDHQE